jgi:hypothetical protein
MFQLSLIVISKNINFIIELLMAQLVDVSIIQNMVTTCFNHPKHGYYMFQGFRVHQTHSWDSHLKSFTNSFHVFLDPQKKLQ